MVRTTPNYKYVVVISFSAFFTLSGSKADSAMVLFGRVPTFNQCFVIMMIMLTVSAAASALAALGTKMSVRCLKLNILHQVVFLYCLHKLVQSSTEPHPIK